MISNREKSLLARAGVTKKELLTIGHYARATMFGDKASIKFLIDAGISPRQEKASATLGDTVGGFLVPSQIEPHISSLRDNFGILRQYASILQMGSDERSWPRRVAGVTANFVQAENGAIPESQLSFDEIRLITKKAAASIRLSNELYEDETVALGAWFILEISAAFARKEDDCGFLGDGTSAYGGILRDYDLIPDGGHKAGEAGATTVEFGVLQNTRKKVFHLMAVSPVLARRDSRSYV